MLRQRCGDMKPVEELGQDLVPHSSVAAPAAADGGTGGGLLSSMLVPDSTLVPEEYWTFRALTTVLGVVSTVKTALTAQAHMIAIGVGDANATPFTYLLIAEINAAIGRFVGLSLSSWASPSFFAMHAKRTMVLNATIGKLGSIFPVLLLLYPEQLRWISLSETLFNVLMSLMVSPANAALWEHMQLSPDPAKRAMVGQINGNQDRLRTFLHMVLRYYAVFVVFADPPEDFTYIWVGVFAGSILEAAVEIWRVLIAAPVTFNRATFRSACKAWMEEGGAQAVAEIENADNWKAAMEDFEDYFKRGELFPELHPRHIAKLERILPTGIISSKPWSSLQLGISLEQLLPVPSGSDVPPWAAASLVNRLLVVHRNERYVLGADAATRTLHVLLKQGATPEDQLKAAFHAYLAESRLDDAENGSILEMSAIVREISAAYPDAAKSWPKFVAVLLRLGWKSTACVMHSGEWRLQPTPLPAHPSLRTATVQRKTRPGNWREWDDDEPRRLTQCKPNPGGDPDTQTFYLHRLVPALPHTYVETHSNLSSADVASSSGMVLEHPQPGASMIDDEGPGGFGSWLYSILLPRGFPDSVAPEYMKYQLWDTLQVMMADLRSIIISRAGLVGQGVGIEGATPLGTMWVDFKVELFSTCQGLFVGGLADAGASASSMKRWRVYKTLLSYFETICTLLQGMYPAHRIHARLVQTGVANLINPFAGGADQALVLHLSNSSQDPAFRADVASKESNQDRALGLNLMPIRFILLFWVGTDWQRAWVVVVALSIGHIVLNYMAAHILVLKTLNHGRFQLAFEGWCEIRGAGDDQFIHDLVAPETIAEKESVLPEMLSASWSSFELGVSAAKLLPAPADPQLVAVLLDTHDREGYILGGHPSGEWLCAVLKESVPAGSDFDSVQFRAAMHAAFVRRQLQEQTEPVTSRWLVEVIVRSHELMDEYAEDFAATLIASGWRCDRSGWLQFNPLKWRLLIDKTA